MVADCTTVFSVQFGGLLDIPYKNTFFKEYRVQFPAVDHGTAKVVSVFLYGRIVYVGYHMVCPKRFLDLEENVVRYHALHQELAVAR